MKNDCVHRKINKLTIISCGTNLPNHSLFFYFCTSLQKTVWVLRINLRRSNLHIPDVKERTTKNWNFLANTIVLPLLAAKIDSANMLGMEISETCKRSWSSYKSYRDWLRKSKTKRPSIKWIICFKNGIGENYK